MGLYKKYGIDLNSTRMKSITTQHPSFYIQGNDYTLIHVANDLKPIINILHQDMS